MSERHVAVVGAGIAGLTAALSLARNGVPVTVIEQAEALSPVGAGVQISPNASAILNRLGLLQRLESRWQEPDAIKLVSGRTLDTLARVPAGRFARKRWRAPYGIVHRAELQKVLYGAVSETPGCRVVLSRRLSAGSPNDLRQQIAETTGFQPALIVGADGVWSETRRLVPGAGKAVFSGYCAFRMTLDASGAGALSGNHVTVCLGPACHLAAYPLAGTQTLNLVAVCRGENPGRTWTGSVDDGGNARKLADATRTWHPRLKALLDNAENRTLWPLFEVSGGATAAGADCVLVGDAAHAMMPFAAQGAAMAIEDGFELAAAVAHETVSAAMLRFHAERRAGRIARVRHRTAFNRFAYHARGPVRLGRDIVMAMRGPAGLAADLDWLYGYRAYGLDQP